MAAPAWTPVLETIDDLDAVFGKDEREWPTIEKSADAIAPLRTLSAAEFCRDDPGPIDYLWKPGLVRGGMTTLYGGPKIGKTTVAVHLVHGILAPRRFSFLDGVMPLGGPVLWLDLEQPRRVSQRRFYEAGAHPDLHIYRGPPPSLSALLATIDSLADAFCPKLLVVDSLTRWLRLENENDNSELERKLGPIQTALHERDVTSVIIDHAGKADGQTGRTLRGASHKLALVDIAVEIKAEGPLHEGRRRLCFTSREEPSPDLIIRLANDRFVVEGTPSQVALAGTEEKVFQALRLGHQRKKDLMEHLGVAERTLETWIKPLVDAGRIKGVKSVSAGAPLVYHIVDLSRKSPQLRETAGNGSPQ